MRLATLDNDTPDGALVLVSADGARMVEVGAGAPNLLALMADWTAGQPALGDAAARLDAGEGTATGTLRAPMPRSWQWLDGSAFDQHGKLMQIAFGLDPIESDRPLMYQGMSDRFYGPNDDIPFPSEDDGIDFEGEFGVIVDAVPMGTSAADAMKHIRLIVQINDWSLRTIAPIEMKTGFGWVQAKPACSIAPIAVTPDELGEDWREGRVCLDLDVEWNGARFGAANGREMAFGFHELVAHAARTRDLVAGTIIGSGTVSSPDYAKVGSSCISERRAIEMIEKGLPETQFMRFGDRVRMAARRTDGTHPFGTIEQTVVQR
ncbi:fumarylacetoacetate hydrolase family protein [Croceicoccus sp. YJ47]|uniref:fumarylacetoacetate hydrolase family protein n=1 Tax=Croceicoccus sp. YJ47 TaxID=2798724 RepID=UPI0019223EBD|nr:fumarylacetoacetate hydrolase family protein [Croceicoccus sp. YJ47]QQN74234.1 fumarylacetoacetate hydrolase family protein [Croceicoccus sp. YJ47]